jgi:beta-glucanase (GH16 family)
MKLKFFSLVLTFSCLSFLAIGQQTVEDDFEGNGTILTWSGDDCGINTSLPNPFQQMSNNSATVLEYNDTDGQYANIRFDAGANFDLSTNYTFSFKIYVPSSGITGNQVNQVAVKLQDATIGQAWSTQSEIVKSINLDQWQTVTFDFKNDNYFNLDPSSPPPIQRTDFNRVLIQINGENNNDLVLAYIDDFYYDGTLNIPVTPVFDNLVWSDEFDTNGAIDGTKWFHQTQLPSGGSWYNGEIQHYTNRTDNASVNSGILSITAKKEAFTDQGHTKQYTSARLNSKFAFKYGKVEIRAKLPTGVGTWPALWMLGKNINEDGGYWDNQGFGNKSWPDCGEIDIMEHWGSNQNYVQSATHTPSSFGGTVNHGGQSISTASTAFHVYSLEWSAERLIFRVDNAVHFIYNPTVKDANTWPFDAEQYLLLNIAIQPSIVSNFTSSAMEIDYVRVYQESPVSITKLDNTSNIKYFPNPVNDQLNIELETALTEAITFNVYNINGQLVKSYHKTVQQPQVKLNDLGDLTAGLYIVSFQSNGQMHHLKFVKK